MRYIILFEDNPGAAPDLRQRHMPQHLAFLAANPAILAAGPVMDEGPAGGLWVVDVAGAAEAEALIRADPFWPLGLRQSWRILHWRVVHEAGWPAGKIRD